VNVDRIDYFSEGKWKGAVNMVNPLGTKGQLAHAFAGILHEMWQGNQTFITPVQFRVSGSISHHCPAYILIEFTAFNNGTRLPI
jgi:hypothetical protein